MKTKAVLFDLDGTLLPMDQDEFVRAYFGRLAAHLAPHGYTMQPLMDTMWRGIAAMMRNTGERTNEAVFWDVFSAAYGADKVSADIGLFAAFYETVFQEVQEVCGSNPQAVQLVRTLKARGVRVALATNPLFPAAATESRVRWAGLSPADFEVITTYENSAYCKPNLHYYQALLDSLRLDAADCVMVGNDVGDDMPARDLGMSVFLLTDCLINKAAVDIETYPHGDFAALSAYLEI